MKQPDGLLLDSVPVNLPTSVYSQFRRSLNSDDYQRFESVQLYNLTYTSNGLAIKAYVALPPATGEKMPTIVFNAGGTGERGALSATTAAATVGLYAAWGYVAFASQYRGRGGSEGLEEWGAGDVEDILHALPMLCSWDYVDAERLGIIGGSRGGMMTYQILARTEAFKAAVTFGAPANFTILAPDSYILQTARKFLPDNADLQDELYRRSAALWADKLCKTTPLLVLHGSGDRRVDASHSYALGLALQKTLHPYKLIVYDNADHVLAGRREESNADIRWWIDHYVKNRAPLPKVGPHGS